MLARLVNRALQRLRFYDATSASVAVCAMGDLRLGPVHAPDLLLHLASLLPAYSHGQMTLLLRGLSQLRVSHHMLIAYALNIFLRSLRQQQQQREDWREAVRAMAAMAHVLQQYHTQRTVRAFLAAADRALKRSSAEEVSTETPSDTATPWSSDNSLHHNRQQGTRNLSFRDSKSLTSTEAVRATVLQLLFLLEVYVNAGIDVAAPHTPHWLCQLLGRVPMMLLALEELLYMHGRLFASVERIDLLVRDDAGSAFPGAPWEVTQRIAMTRAVLTHTMRLVRVASGNTGADVFSDAWVQQAYVVWQRICEREQHELLRCAVFRLVHPKDGSETDPDGGLFRDKKTVECVGVWLSCMSALSYHRLSREFFAALCAGRWTWWLDLGIRIFSADTKSQATPTYRSTSCGVPFTGPHGDEILSAWTVLQLLHGRYTRAYHRHASVSESSENARRRSLGDVCNALAKAEEDKDDHDTGLAVQTALAFLIAAFSACEQRTDFSTTPHAVSGKQWDLLLLLLLTLHGGAPQTKFVPPFRWWLHEQFASVKEDSERSPAPQASNTSWETFLYQCENLMVQLLTWWCYFWASRSDMGNGSVRTNFVMTELGAAHELEVHWGIAECVDCLYAHAACDVNPGGGDDKCNATSTARRVVHRLHASVIVSGWQSLCAVTSAQLTRDTTARHDMHTLQPTATQAQRLAKLEALLLHVLSRCFRRRAIEGWRHSLGHLGNVMENASLPTLVCDAIERSAIVSKSMEDDHAAEVAPVLPLLPDRTHHDDAAAECFHWWADQAWWSTCHFSENGSAAKDVVALQELLRCLFPPTHAGLPVDTCVAPVLPFAWPYRLLLSYLRRRRSRSGQRRSSRQVPSTGPLENEAEHPDPRTEVSNAALSFQTLESVWSGGQTGYADPFVASPLPHLLSFPCAESSAACQGPTYPTQTAHTMMSMIESFWSWGDDVFASETLREAYGSVFCAPSAYRTINVPRTALHRLWFCDSRVVRLVKSDGLRKAYFGFCREAMHGRADLSSRDKSSSATSASRSLHSTGLLARFRDAVNHVKVITRALEGLRGSPALCLESASSVAVFSPVYYGSVARAAPASGFAPPDRDTERVSPSTVHDLCAFFLDYGIEVLAHSRWYGAEEAKDDPLSVGRHVREGDAALLLGVLQWQRLYSESEECCRARQLKHSSRCRAEFNTKFLHTAQSEQLMQLLICELWRALHRGFSDDRQAKWQRQPLCVNPAADCTADVVFSENIMDIWRLLVFANYWYRQLPLHSSHLPAQERLVAYLHAALLHLPDHQLRQDVPRQVAVVSHIEAKIAERLWMKEVKPSFSILPLGFLSHAIHAISRCLHGSWPQPMRHALRIDSATASDVDDNLSPVEAYLRCLLPLHPFLVCDDFQQLRCVPEVRTVVLTWVHSVVLQSICMYHPRMDLPCTHDGSGETAAASPRSNRGQDHHFHALEALQKALFHLRSLEQQLLSQPALSRNTTTDVTQQHKHEVLLRVRLVREMSLALAELLAWLQQC